MPLTLQLRAWSRNAARDAATEDSGLGGCAETLPQKLRSETKHPAEAPAPLEPRPLLTEP